MSEFEEQKYTIVQQLQSLCAHCANQVSHDCRVKTIANEVQKLSGVPLIVNDRFNGILFVN